MSSRGADRLMLLTLDRAKLSVPPISCLYTKLSKPSPSYLWVVSVFSSNFRWASAETCFPKSQQFPWQNWQKTVLWYLSANERYMQRKAHATAWTRLWCLSSLLDQNILFNLCCFFFLLLHFCTTTLETSRNSCAGRITPPLPKQTIKTEIHVHLMFLVLFWQQVKGQVKIRVVRM